MELRDLDRAGRLIGLYPQVPPHPLAEVRLLIDMVPPRVARRASAIASQ